MDKHTLSNYTQIEVQHAEFAWEVDFSAKTLSGSVLYTVKVLDAEIDTITLDTSHLIVKSVAVVHADGSGGLHATVILLSSVCALALVMPHRG